jgi:dihydrofolate reductase
MRTVVVHVFDYSLDGVIGEEGTEFEKFCRDEPDDPAYEAWLADSLGGASLHIVGRVTYEGMARHFPTATDPIADAMNRIPKAVFSSTLQTTDWAGTTIVSGDTATEIAKLKRDGDGCILAHGGVSFVRSLVQLDLVDEYRLTIHPYLAATGPRLFDDLPGAHPLELVSSTVFSAGVLAAVYRRSR